METVSANSITSYIIRSQEEEMKRIAFELHEGVGQTLYSLLTGLQVIEPSITQPIAKNYLQEMSSLIEKTILEVRMLSVELHPPSLSSIGLLAAIKSYSRLFTSTYGIMIDIQNVGNEIKIAEHYNVALFRVCQEALANIAKYADTSQANIVFTWEETMLNIEIRDLGKGFNVDEKVNITSGIAAMKERMQLIGGDCTISSQVGVGTMIKIRLPIVGN
jgi:signal transduction histidine kinase